MKRFAVIHKRKTSNSATRHHSKKLNSTSRLRTIKRKLKCLTLEQIKEYCDNSTIHGFRYHSDKNIHGFERMWWILSFVVSMIGCYMLIRDSYIKWDENPVIVTFSEKMMSINAIPFPAVTICPETKSIKNIFNFSESLYKIDLKSPPYYGLSEDEYMLASTQFQICNKDVASQFVRSLDGKTTNNTIFELIMKMAPSMGESLLSCTFKTFFSCSDIFQNIITEEGLCFTLNSLINEEMFHNGSNSNLLDDQSNIEGVMGHWTMEDGYDDMETSESSAYPHRVYTSGSNMGLVLTLALKEVDMDYVCRGPQQGFKVILHSPNELPDVNGQYFRIPVKEDVRVSIKPNMMITSKSLKAMDSERRQCYFNSERTLRLMKTYTQQNCQLECLSNFTFEVCGCVRFSMPRDNETPVCGVTKILCYLSLENEFWKYGDLDEYEYYTKICNCLPACTSISYDAEISQSEYDYDKFMDKLDDESLNPLGLKFSRLSIFFKENQFVSSKRSELIGMTDFVAACGGLLGLFMGFSLLSIVEFVYYFSLRLWCGYRLKKSTIEPHGTVGHSRFRFDDNTHYLARHRNNCW